LPPTVGVLVISKSVNQPFFHLTPVEPISSVSFVSEIKEVLIATLAKLSNAVVAPDAPAAQVKTPLPFVCRNWLASPSVVGKVKV
jgi:hypothetical protein